MTDTSVALPRLHVAYTGEAGDTSVARSLVPRVDDTGVARRVTPVSLVPSVTGGRVDFRDTSVQGACTLVSLVFPSARLVKLLARTT